MTRTDRESEKRNGRLLGAAETSVASEPHLPKVKGTKLSPDYQIVWWQRVKVSKRCTLARQRSIRAGAWGRKSGLHSEGKQVLRKRKRASNGNLSRRSKRKHERISGRKSSPGAAGESWFYFKSGQI